MFEYNPGQNDIWPQYQRQVNLLWPADRGGCEGRMHIKNEKLMEDERGDICHHEYWSNVCKQKIN